MTAMGDVQRGRTVSGAQRWAARLGAGSIIVGSRSGSAPLTAKYRAAGNQRARATIRGAVGAVGQRMTRAVAAVSEDLSEDDS